ncbi:T3SS effector HopA1 family protein [Synechococcus sp. CBW1006]|uniref:T3SS effector HopA1 family protein n=1 Tax=Synechococcus sp. CBW1006 TaxID=1353138 RepID=UPI0018CEE87D|nr:T3SS effector HopA1 family protein [Synechococcus sp. CBW1006]QPN67092.1 hypothetical protein H8F26_02035 [Synechococcus sp. CBW1006]
MPDFLGDLEDLSPDIFTRVSADGLDFYKLYNRSQGLSKAIAQLEEDYQACCLIHNDLRFNNVLLHHDWPLWQSQRLPTSAAALNLNEAQGVIRLIDWEQWAWGDPALDVGAIVAEYLRVWLKSLMLSRDIDLEVALRLAAVPLERLQPSLVAFLQAYLAQFPKIFDVFSDFPERVLRFSGLGLIGSIQDRLHYREPFGNLEISMLQVAKSLLCQPRAAMVTIFGCTEFSPSDFASHTVVDTGETALIQSIQDKDDFLSDAPLPYWVQHYSLDDALADLIANIRIEPPLIQHPAYAPLDLTHPGDDKASDQNRKRYSALPDQLKQAYKLRQVRNYLFDIYFSGEQESRSLTRPREKSFQNNTAAGLDIDFLRQIQSANRGRGFSDPSWIVIRLEADRIQVEKDGLRLWVDPSSDLAIDRVSMPQLSKSEMLSFLSVGMAVSLLLPNACLDGDFYVAIGNEGEPSVDQARINIYFHVTSDGAIVLLDVFTTAFNRMACPYSLSVLNDPSLYGRYNAAVLELKADDYIHLRSALQENYAGLRSHLKDPIPLFTQSIAPGIGLAESLQDKEDVCVQGSGRPTARMQA